MRARHLESLTLHVSDLGEARAFYIGALGLPVLFEDGASQRRAAEAPG